MRVLTMSVWRRLVVGSFLAALVAGPGFGVFWWVRHRPRATIEQPGLIQHLSADGRWLVALDRTGAPHDRADAAEMVGRLQVFDTHTGRLVHRLAVPLALHQSPGGDHFWWRLDDGAVMIADWRRGEVWSPPVKVKGDPDSADHIFAPGGRWLLLRGADPAAPSVIVDVPARRVAHRRKETMLHFSGDGRYAFLCLDDQRAGVLDLDKGATVATLTFDFPLERVGMVFSRDGRRMAVGNVLSLYQATAFDVPSGEIAAPSERFAFLDLEVWDLVEFRRLWQAKPARTARHSSLTFSADGRYLAAWVMFDLEQRLEVIDLEEGAAHQLPRHADTPGASAWNRATPPRLVFPHPPAKDTGDERGRLLFSKGAGGCRMFDVAERRLLWEFVHFSDCDVLAGTDVVLCQSAANASTETLDPWTGKHQFNLTAGFRIPAQGAFPHGVNLDAVARGRAGGHVAFQGVPAPDAPLPGWRAWLEKKWPKVFDSNRPQVLVVDAATGQERLRVTAPAVGLMLSDDAGTLLTLHGPVTWEAAGPATSIQVWDVPPYRAAAWGATTAALMAGALMAGALALFYRRRRQADAARAASGRDVPPVSAKPG